MKILLLILHLCFSAAESAAIVSSCQTNWNPICVLKAQGLDISEKAAYCSEQSASSNYIVDTDNCEYAPQDVSCETGWSETCFLEISSDESDPDQFCGDTAMHVSFSGQPDQCRLPVIQLVGGDQGGGAETDGWGNGSFP